MDYKTIEKRVIEIVQEQFGNENINAETDLIKNLGIDSLDLTEIIMELEDEFEISLPSEEADKYLSKGGEAVLIRDLVDYIAKKRGIEQN